MRIALFALLLAGFALGHAQTDALVSPLPEGANSGQVLSITRQVLVARGWKLITKDRASLQVENGRSAMRVFVADGALRFSDLSQGSQAPRQRYSEENRPKYDAVSAQDIATLRADLAAALDGKRAVQVLLAVPAGADAQRVMEAARNAFARRRWGVSSDAEGALVARNRTFDVDATIRVFYADGALRFIDGTVDAKGRKAQVPERWLSYIRGDLYRPLGELAREGSRPVPPPPPPRAPTALARDQDAEERLRRLQS